jgi:(R,R)-butanediol dehydrogenase/meso-butanediol dehydrogenase/diacetyl reductase
VRAVKVAEDRRLVVVECPAPEPGQGQALVEVSYCGICGSDLHFREVPELFPAGTVPGHEFSGRIARVGDGVRTWSAGDRVCVLPFGQCGECAICRAGNEQVCPHAVSNGVGLGTGRPGAYAEQVVVDERMLFSLPESVDDRAGTLVEPLAAVALGLDTASIEEVAQAPPAASPACVFDCAGTPAAAQLAVQTLRPLGRLLLVGLSLTPLDLAAPAIVIKELEIQGVIAYRRAQFQAAIDMLARGVIPVGELITEIVPLVEAEAAFQALTARGSEKVKILLAP